MQRTRMSLSSHVLGSDPAEELPAGAGERIPEVGDCSKTYCDLYLFKAIYFLFMYATLAILYFAPFH